MQRRDVLATGGTVGMAVLAGCYSASSSNQQSDRSVEKAKIREMERSKWEQINDSGTQKFQEFGEGPLETTAHGRTLTFGYKPIRNRIHQRTLNSFDRHLVFLFASRVELAGVDEVGQPVLLRKTVSQRVKSRMNRIGQAQKSEIRAVSKTNATPNTTKVATGETAQRLTFSGLFVRRDVPFNFDVPEKGTQQGRFEKIEIQINAFALVWRHNDRLYIAGGAHPAESISNSKRVSVTGGLGSGIDVTVWLNIQTNPNQNRRRLETLAKSVR